MNLLQRHFTLVSEASWYLLLQEVVLVVAVRFENRSTQILMVFILEELDWWMMQ